jgi:ATP-dependent Zn protease
LVFGGIAHEALPKNVREELKTKAYTLLKQCQENAMRILVDNRDALVAIADELLKKQILNDTQIREIIKSVESRDEKVAPATVIDNTEETVETPTEQPFQEVITE